MSWARQQEARERIFKMFDTIGLNTSARRNLIDQLDAFEKATRAIALTDAANRLGSLVRDREF